MFYLTDADGKTVTMRSGLPFVYSSRELASIARRILAKELGRQLLVRED